MTLPTTADFNNAKRDLDDLAEIVTSPTVKDVPKRLGGNTPTLSKVMSETTDFLATQTQRLADRDAEIDQTLVRLRDHAPVRNRGAWITGTTYEVNDIWQAASDVWYVVVEEYVAGATDIADVASGKVFVHQVNIVADMPADTIADLRLFEPSQDGQHKNVTGHTFAGSGGGPFYYDASDTTSPDNDGTVIVTASGKRWKRKVHMGEFVGISSFGALEGSNNSDIVRRMLAQCRLISLDVPSILSNIEITQTAVAKNLRFDSNVIIPVGASYFIQINGCTGININGDRYSGNSVFREGSGKVISIVGSSDYANKSVSISNIEAKGGEGTFMQWSSCDDLEFKNNYIHDGVGTGIYNVNTQLSNSYKSRNIKFDRNYIHDLGVGSDMVSHGISINSWRYIFGVTATKNDIRRVRNNGIEFWANFVRVSGNYVEDSRIAYSYGQCHYLTHSDGNIAHNTVPNTSSTPDSVGGLGIEIGGCTRVVLNNYVIDGYRSGIEATESVISTPQDTIWHDPTAVKYGDSGTLSNADSPSFMRLKTLFGERNLSGSYYVSIGQGVITNYLNYGIHCSADNQYRDTYVINGPRISHGGKYAESTKAAAAAIFISNASASVSNAVVSDATHYGINADHGRLTLGLNNFRNIEGDVVRIVGSGSSLHCPVKQDIQECPVLGSALSDTPTQGTFSESQEWVNHTSSGGGAAQRFVVSDGGTFGTMLSTTANTISGSKIATLSRSVNPVGVVQRGMFIEIVGVSGSFKVIDIGIPVDTGSGWTLEVDLDSNADTTVSGAVVSHHAPTVESVGQNGYRSSVSSAPDFIGQEAIFSGQFYKAKGIATSSDWVVL